MVIFLALRRRKFIRVVSYLTALAVVFAASGYFSQRAKADYEETLGKVRLTNLTSLCEYSRDISAGLRLVAVSADNSQADSKTYVSSRSMGAIGCLNCFENENVENMSRFFSGVYSFAENFSGSEAERKTAIELSNYAQEIYYHLNDVSSAVMNGAYSLTEHGSAYSRSNLPYFEEKLDYSNGREKELFELIKPVSADAGAFSLLEGKEKISENEAKEKAGKILGINPSLWRKNDGSQSEFDVYSLVYGDIFAEICKSGGAVCRLVNPVACKEAFYSLDEAEKLAQAFLKQQGYRGMAVMGGETSEFTACFYFVPEVNGILLLTSPVYINVCLASGKISYLDASAYIKNYRTDIFANMGNPNLKGVLPEYLVLEETLNCFADINGRKRLCYLAVCSFEAQKIWVFIENSSFRILSVQAAM